MTSLRSPEELSHRLGLLPTLSQCDMMHRFYEDEDPLQVVEVLAEQTTNAVALCALWRLLLVPESRCIVIASSLDLQSRFLNFMRDVTTKIDPALTSVCKWSSSKTLCVGNTSGYGMRFISNHPAFLQGLHGATTFIVLGAGSSEPKFCETMEVLNTYQGQEGSRHILMW